MEPDLAVWLRAMDVPADWLGLRYVSERTLSIRVRDGLPQPCLRDRRAGVFVEVLTHGQFGYGSTDVLTPDSLRRAAQQAQQRAIAAARFPLFAFSEQQRPPSQGTYRSPFTLGIDHIEVGAVHELAIALSRALRVSAAIVSTTATFWFTETETHFVSSNGADIHQHTLTVATDLAATAMDGPHVQKRSDRGAMARCRQTDWGAIAQEPWLARAETIGAQALALLTAEECPTTTTNLVLAPDQMLLQIHESIGHPLELDRILGDERNYAGTSFVQPSDFGTLQYGSPLLNATFAPDVPGEFASYRFDDTGVPACKTYLIRDGILVRGLGSLESQARSGLPGTANARAASWNRPPIDRMANLNLEPGPDPLDDIIGAIADGVYMESNRSWSIDDRRHKFQFGCEYARQIKDGKLTKVWRNPNYRGTTLSFWRSLQKVGNTVETYGSPFCGKGEPNQAIRVGHQAPPCWFANVEVFGGG
ncbi:MAG: TldD/PmbA family protein [Pseudanabaenaceae cyanobacterium]